MRGCARKQESSNKLDIDVCDEAGRICVRLSGYSTREVANVSGEISVGTLLLQRVWQPRSVEADGAPSYGPHLVVLCGGDAWAPQVGAKIASALPQARLLTVDGLESGIAQRYEAAVLQILAVLQRLVNDKPKDDVLIQLVVPLSGEDAVLAGLSGLLKTVQLEQPKIRGQVVGVEARASAAQDCSAFAGKRTCAG